MLTPRRRCFDYSKVYYDVTERWLLAWNQNKHIIYYIFHILIQKALLVFHTFAPTSFDDSNLMIGRLQSLICQLTFWSVSRSNHFGVIIVLRISNDADSRKPIPETSHFHAVLLTRLACQKLPSNIEDSLQQFEKETFVSIDS